MLIGCINASALRTQTFTLSDTTFQVGDILMHNIYFDYNSNGILPESKPFLDSLGAFMQVHDSLMIEIGNHTDYRGSDKYNLKLSEMRSKMIKRYLVYTAKIPDTRLTPAGYGETQPIIPNETIEAMETEEEKEKAFQKNRRCEFKITSTSYPN